MKIQRLTYLSLGSNQGEKLKNLQKAIFKIAETVGAIQKISSVYKTSSWGYKGEDFYNMCIAVSTYLQPESLLEKLLTIESNLGRERNNLHEYTDRKIDIDIQDIAGNALMKALKKHNAKDSYPVPSPY